MDFLFSSVQLHYAINPIILNAEQDMKNNQNKIQKKHRNRNHGYWKFEAKRQKKLKFENGK